MRTSLLAILILACLIGSPALAAEMTGTTEAGDTSRWHASNMAGDQANRGDGSALFHAGVFDGAKKLLMKPGVRP